MVCTQRTEMNEQIYLASPHIGVSSRRTGVLVEDIYLSRKHYSRQIFTLSALFHSPANSGTAKDCHADNS